MAHPVVTFPQPPPTSNNLTPNQRQQLLRSTRKLTKLLGSAPHLIDHDNPIPIPAVYLDLSNKLGLDSRTSFLSRRSCEIPRPPSPASSISSVSTTASKIHHKSRSSSYSENYIPQDASDSPFSRRRPPMLRLASTGDGFSQSVWTSTKLDPVPGSPPAFGDIDFSQSSPVCDVSDGDSTDHLLGSKSLPVFPITPSLSRSYTLPVPRKGPVPSLSIDTAEPSFKVTSEAATRRLKMERIRKRLGECVPVGAVFPDDENEDEDQGYVEVIAEKKPAQVNVDVSPRWKSSSAVVAFDVIYECPDEHGDEGLANGLTFGPKTSKSPTTPSTRNSGTFPRQWGKLIKRTRGEPCF